MNSIGPEAETEAAIYAEGTRFSKADILKAYREHGEDIGMQAFCEEILGIPGVDDSGLREAGVYMPTSVLCRISGLSLVRIGQMLGSDTRLAKAVHDAIDVVLHATR